MSVSDPPTLTDENCFVGFVSNSGFHCPLPGKQDSVVDSSGLKNEGSDSAIFFKQYFCSPPCVPL